MRFRAEIVMMTLLAGVGAGAAAFGATDAQAPPAKGPPRDAHGGARRGAPKREIASPITDHFALRAGAFMIRNATTLRIDPKAGGIPGTVLSGENDLGLRPKGTQGNVELMFRMRERHRLTMDFFQLDRDGFSTLARPIVLGNNLYLLNDHVASRFNWEVLSFTYTYSFVKTERFEVGAGLGLHFLQAEASADVRARNLRQSNSAVGGFPTIALDGTWRISSRWAVQGRLQYFSATVSHIKGSASDNHFDLQYRWRPNFQLGLGYSAMSTKLDSTAGNTDLQGSFNLDSKGPEAFFRVSF